jgi:hypothetical protein
MTVVYILVFIYFTVSENRYKYLIDCDNQEDIEEFLRLNEEN